MLVHRGIVGAGAEGPSTLRAPGPPPPTEGMIVSGVNPRTRGRLIDGLRSVARQSRQQKRRRFEVLLCRRAAAVSGELLGLAALLDITDDPDPAAIDSLLALLTDGVESPLYNPQIHVAQLHATLVDSRRRLLRAGGG